MNLIPSASPGFEHAIRAAKSHFQRLWLSIQSQKLPGYIR